ncbi:MAG: tetratricopeptide repeat protein [Flavobacteriales bacterium]
MRLSSISFSMLFVSCTTVLLAQEAQVGVIKTIRRGNKAYERSDWAAAQTEYLKALKGHAGSLKANYNLGNAYYRGEALKRALAQYRLSVGLSQSKSRKANALYNMGNVLMKQQRYAPAVKAYLQALRNAPKDDEIRYNYALAKSRLKKQKQGGKNQNKKDRNQKDQNEKGQGKNGGTDNKGQNQRDSGKNSAGDKHQQPGNPSRDRGQPKSLSNRQIDRLLQALQNAEGDTQKKVWAKRQEEKQKERASKAEKDW